MTHTTQHCRGAASTITTRANQVASAIMPPMPHRMAQKSRDRLSRGSNSDKTSRNPFNDSIREIAWENCSPSSLISSDRFSMAAYAIPGQMAMKLKGKSERRKVERRPSAEFIKNVDLIRRQLAAHDKRKRWLIDPRKSPYLGLWDATAGVALCYIAVVTPFEVCFLDTAMYVQHATGGSGSTDSLMESSLPIWQFKTLSCLRPRWGARAAQQG
eukprot:7377384-Prymnesium_polylepis.2